MGTRSAVMVKKLINETIKTYITEKGEKKRGESLYFEVSRYISENNWFGLETTFSGKDLYIDHSSSIILSNRIESFLRMNDMDTDEKVKYFTNRIRQSFPVMNEALEDFFRDCDIDTFLQYRLLDCLNEYIERDLLQITDKELKTVINRVFEDQYKYIGDLVCFFFAYVKDKTEELIDVAGRLRRIKKYKVTYIKKYLMGRRVDTSDQTTAYDQDEYLEMLYKFTNSEYIEENKMYKKAAESKQYVDTWLFIALHFICAIRDSDYAQLFHPSLRSSPEDILTRVANGSFSKSEAKAASMELMEWMYYLGPRPQKTNRYNNVSPLRFFIPDSAEDFYGTLFTVAEAHHRLAGLTNEEPLIHKITTYQQIIRYMGEDIGSIFLSHDFRSRKANKSYMQGLELFADPILENAGLGGAKAYLLVSMSRSHKGGYMKFASTTAEYLKDANFSGMSAEFVAKELFERGILSSVVSMLLKIMTNNEFAYLPASDQTSIMKATDITASQAEALVKITNKAQKRAELMVNQLLTYAGGSESSYVMEILHRLAVGDAPSREPNILCISVAVSGKCVYEGEKHPCLGCDYEVGTKAAAYHLIQEYNRFKSLHQKAESFREKEKYEWAVKERLLPFLNEMLNCMSEQYGPDYAAEFSSILKKNIIT